MESCECGGQFRSKQDTLVLSWKLKLATVVAICNNCGTQKMVLMTITGAFPQIRRK